MKIILDTNFLMAIVQFKIDIFEQLAGNSLYTIESVINELKGLSKEKSKDGTAAKIALDIIKSKGLKILESKDVADLSLIDYSNKGYIIATQDKVLQNKIKSLGGKSIYIRQKKYVIL
ncbi:MAG: DNA-binding protein [Nanoarchaeota archaeon]|nr:DNA-binding protein [Nanoarchaeota archaeon]